MSDLEIMASDGFALSASRFDAVPSQRQARTVVINAALGVPRQYYRTFAEYLADQGLTSLLMMYVATVSPDPAA